MPKKLSKKNVAIEKSSLEKFTPGSSTKVKKPKSVKKNRKISESSVESSDQGEMGGFENPDSDFESPKYDEEIDAKNNDDQDLDKVKLTFYK
jgi:hypothetical protein